MSRVANGIKLMNIDKSPTGSRSSANAISDLDKYGMKALLPVVLPAADGKTENMLTVGLDLTGLGLNLNSAEALHKTFDNPWDGGQQNQQYQQGHGHADGHHEDGDVVDGVLVDGQLSSSTGSASWKGNHKNNSISKSMTKDGDLKLPTCYYMQPPSLRSSHFNKFQAETLFYIFYNMPRDVLQLLAAVELYERNWRYHKDLKLWFSCDVEVLQCSYERSGYVYFDIKAWERRPFHDANHSFIQGLMSEEEIHAINIPSL